LGVLVSPRRGYMQRIKRKTETSGEI